jgi:hypothetical protein
MAARHRPTRHREGVTAGSQPHSFGRLKVFYPERMRLTVPAHPRAHSQRNKRQASNPKTTV